MRQSAYAMVRRNDELFSSIRNGPALRVVVDADDDQTMIQYWFEVKTARNWGDQGHAR
jgi:hypothetical protein